MSDRWRSWTKKTAMCPRASALESTSCIDCPHIPLKHFVLSTLSANNKRW